MNFIQSRVCRHVATVLCGVVLAMGCAIQARADWHYGRVMEIYVGYDGNAFTFRLEGVNRSNCTCYSSWPQQICLDRTRASFKEELALVVMAKAQDRRLAVNIDENSCKVIAFGMDP